MGHQLVAEPLQTLPGKGGHIVTSLDAVLLLTRASCPSCVAVSLTLDPDDQSVTITAIIRSNRHRHAPAMTVRLPRSNTHDPARQTALLVVYATDPLSLTRLAGDLTALLGIEPETITLAAEAQVPQTASADLALSGQLTDRTAIDLALGVLLDQGWISPNGRHELQRRASDAGASLAQAAATILSALSGTAPQRPS
jgi:hypothetical protein